jgi:hypothetical protein
LQRLVAEGRRAADQRLWHQLAGPLPSETADALLRLLDVPDVGKRRVSELERLRKGLFRTSSKGMVAALNRLADLVAVDAGSLDVSVPLSEAVAHAERRPDRVREEHLTVSVRSSWPSSAGYGSSRRLPDDWCGWFVRPYGEVQTRHDRTPQHSNGRACQQPMSGSTVYHAVQRAGEPTVARSRA